MGDGLKEMRWECETQEGGSTGQKFVAARRQLRRLVAPAMWSRSRELARLSCDGLVALCCMDDNTTGHWKKAYHGSRALSTLGSVAGEAMDMMMPHGWELWTTPLSAVWRAGRRCTDMVPVAGCSWFTIELRLVLECTGVGNWGGTSQNAPAKPSMQGYFVVRVGVSAVACLMQGLFHDAMHETIMDTFG